MASHFEEDKIQRPLSGKLMELKGAVTTILENSGFPAFVLTGLIGELNADFSNRASRAMQEEYENLITRMSEHERELTAQLEDLRRSAAATEATTRAVETTDTPEEED